MSGRKEKQMRRVAKTYLFAAKAGHQNAKATLEEACAVEKKVRRILRAEVTKR